MLGLSAIATALFLYDEERTGSICNDGWESESTGAGRCSSHDGVAEDISVDTLVGLAPESRLNVSPLLLGGFGVLDLVIGAGLITVAHRDRRNGPLPGSFATNRTHRHDDAPTGAGDAGIIELTATVRSGGAGRTTTVRVDGGPATTVPFLLDPRIDRGAAQLNELMARTPRRFSRQGRPAIERYGADLFDALLPDPAAHRYREARSVALQTGARLRLVLDLDDETNDHPWEYLFDATRSSFLAMSHDTSVVRLVNDGEPTRSIAPVERLRVLVMGASPRDMAQVDLADAHNRIVKALDPHADRVAVHRVEGETFDDLRRALALADPHVFVFVGHGQWHREADDGVIVFSDDHGGRDPISGRDLGVMLNRPELRLVLFASCDAARTSRRDRFAGVAGSLVAQGVPATIGMQYPVGDQSALIFAGQFLESLVGSRSIDQALTEARTAIYTGRSAVEWGTPVFTTRVPVDELIPWAW